MKTRAVAVVLALGGCAPRPEIASPTPIATAGPAATRTPTAAASPLPPPYKADAGPYFVHIEDRTFADPRGVRDVHARIWVPDKTAGKVPVIVFSHGLGGGHSNNAYAGRHWASHGYLVVHPTHPGSDVIAAASHSLREIGNDASVWTGRAWDVSFVLDSLADDELGKRADLTRVGVTGHSLGAHTALVMLGMTLDLPEKEDASFRDPRVLAGVAMSPPGPGILGVHEDDYERIAVPVLVLTGTRDSAPGTPDPLSHRIPFDRSNVPGSILVTIQDAEHLAFGDYPSLRHGPRDPRHHGWILQETTAFWDAWLKGDANARAWLRIEALETITRGEVVIDSRP